LQGRAVPGPSADRIRFDNEALVRAARHWVPELIVSLSRPCSHCSLFLLTSIFSRRKLSSDTRPVGTNRLQGQVRALQLNIKIEGKTAREAIDRISASLKRLGKATGWRRPAQVACRSCGLNELIRSNDCGIPRASYTTLAPLGTKGQKSSRRSAPNSRAMQNGRASYPGISVSVTVEVPIRASATRARH